MVLASHPISGGASARPELRPRQRSLFNRKQILGDYPPPVFLLTLPRS
jgi:hypothetical protein